jgi:hypothetical protein
MPNQNPDAEAALKKLGERVRDGFNKKHPASERSLDTFRKAIRDGYEQEQKLKREDAVNPPAHTKKPEPKKRGRHL